MVKRRQQQKNKKINKIKINGIERVEEEEENMSLKKANQIHLAVLYDEAAKQTLNINGAIHTSLVRSGSFLDSLMRSSTRHL